jgi:CheY-like chemotaxis protein
MNLCTNAYHAMRQNGGTLSVTLKEIEVSESLYPELDLSPGRYLQLAISDSGTGMDEETIGKIFEPYYTTKDLGEGTGLGLAVVHGVVESNGGYIKVCSEVDQGTTFQVYLPVCEGECELSAEHPQKTPLLGGNETIMLVDDESLILDSMKKFLERHGYAVDTFTNGVQACQEFQQQPQKYDLVITDMTMPSMTGIQLSHKLIEAQADIPIILCTGHSELTNGKESLAMGIKEYLEKPVDFQMLTRTIRKLLDSAKIAGASPAGKL